MIAFNNIVHIVALSVMLTTTLSSAAPIITSLVDNSDPTTIGEGILAREIVVPRTEENLLVRAEQEATAYVKGIQYVRLQKKNVEWELIKNRRYGFNHEPSILKKIK